MTEITTDQIKLMQLLRMAIDSTIQDFDRAKSSQLICSAISAIKQALWNIEQYHLVNESMYWDLYRAIFREIRAVMAYTTISTQEIIEVLLKISRLYY